MATETASKKCAFSVMMLLLFLGGETLKLGSENVSDEYDPRNHAVEDPEEVVRMFEMATRNSSLNRRKLNEGINCHIINPMDACWRCVKGGWRITRKRLASCALGFGLNAIGGLHGKYYYVTTSRDDDPVNPRPGTLRFGVIQTEPLWIVFKRDMTITLKQELIMNSYKTIDGRGRCVRIKHKAGITLQYIKHVIIIGLTISDIVPTGNALVRSSPSHFGWRTMADGDAISIFGSSHIWIDHNTLSNCADGLVDVIMGSTAITISNNHFTHHNEVMLLGHSDDYVLDKFMQVTIAYNHFGKGLVQRMPRCRHGYFHVVNNEYTHWEMYAIGGSAKPTINSQGNLFLAPANLNAKEVTKRVYAKQQDWSHWNWRSEGDLLLNGAYFIASGEQDSTVYARASSSSVIMPYSKVSSLIAHAGNTLCGNKRHKKHKNHHPCL